MGSSKSRRAHSREAPAPLQRNVPQRRTVRVEEFRLFKELGKGSFATVYLGHNERRNEYCAVKAINAPTAEMRKHALKEVEIHRRVNHPNIVGYLGAREQENSRKVLLYMDYVSRGSLQDLVCKMPEMTINTCLFFFEQLVTAMEYLHLRGIFHRDIKCENLLVTRDGTIKLADFGLADFFVDSKGNELRHRLRAGSYHCMAPEIFMNKSTASYSGAPTDIWSAAIVLVYLITTVYPWNRPDQRDPCFLRWIETRSLGQTWKELSSSGTRALVDKMLRATPRNRIGASDVLKYVQTQLFEKPQRKHIKRAVTTFLRNTSN